MRYQIVLALTLAFGLSGVSSRVLAECSPPPPPVRDLDVPRFYSDDEGTVVDAALLARHRAAVEPLSLFLRTVVSQADKAHRRTKAVDQQAAARCAVRWLDAWAQGDAWLGEMGSLQGEYQRKWDLAGVALAYLKVRAFTEPDERRRIEGWLSRWAAQARAFFDDPRRRRNNHWYWLGLGLAATALATDSPTHWEMARGIMQDAARDIAADGTLPLELERRARALHYHVFAVTPLVVLAELARVRGEDWYAFEAGALHRLVTKTVAGLRDPVAFRLLAGVEQEPGTGPGAGWLHLYSQRFGARIEKIAGRALPVGASGHRWLGGDVRVLAEVIAGMEAVRSPASPIPPSRLPTQVLPGR